MFGRRRVSTTLEGKAFFSRNVVLTIVRMKKGCEFNVAALRYLILKSV